MLKIALTFDYELFFGKNYHSDEEILFAPTENLLKLFAETGARSTFFADVCSVQQHHKQNLTDYPERFTGQLKQLYRNSQDIQLHIHSHWLKSNYSNGQWEFDIDSYRIHTYGFDEQKPNAVQEIIREGKKYLVDTLLPVNPDYQCIAFRAGGFCIQPTEQLFEVLIKNGIVIDSSVLQYVSNEGFYDYKNLPDKLNWYMQPATGLKEYTGDDNHKIFEVAIGAYRNKLWYPMRYSYDKRHISFRKDIGTFINFGNKKSKSKASLLSRLWNYSRTFTPLSTDSVDALMLTKGLDAIYKKYHAAKSDCYISLIGHPKLVTDKTIDSLSRLISHVNNHPDRYCLVTFRDIYNEIHHAKIGE